ncbi:hypothetical protein [Kribbella voronezhensis]|uniref:hypothetical protein n=1 Tax=Kribbella voronezhensis TaxID=2512212 RepID=UPI001416F254|nr:hypothetical protein [Kribbella voronezhensis]
MSLPAYRAADPARTYYAFQGGWSFLSALAFTLNMVYFVKDVGLSPLQLVLVGTTLEVACFAFERSRPASWPTCTAAGCRWSSASR